MMSMRLLHALAALFTVVLLFIRQRCAVCAGAGPAKREPVQASPCSCGDSPFAALPLLSEDCVVCNRAACFYEECGQPKYKRDPDISIDNESIGQHPHDY